MDRLAQKVAQRFAAEHYSPQWLREMEEILQKHGYNPKDAKALADEGMGPEELEHRIKTTHPGGMGSLEYTHRLKKMPGSHVAVSPPGWEGTVEHMKDHKDIDNPFALAWSMKNKGYTPHK